MSSRIPKNLKSLNTLVAQGEGPALEFKRSTGEMREAMQTLCAFLNTAGGIVLFGVRPNGSVEGQDVSDQTLREIAQSADRFEPPADLQIQRIKVAAGREVLAIGVEPRRDSLPFTYEGRPYERLGSSSKRMPQGKYERLLLARMHARHRWENEPAAGYALRDIDREAVFQVVEAARAASRLVGPVGRALPNILARFGVLREGALLQAAVVLFGKTFLPDYPQCELRMARFRGLDKAEFLDQKVVRGPALKLLEEALLFCQRHLPLPGRIEPGRLERVDRPLIPPDALREILVNALIHRDYSIAGGAVSLAIFDDRVEVWSAGTFPAGITPDMLTQEHPSVPRNPIIAEVFNRAGLIEKWGRGTNRVVQMCTAAGIRPPEFSEVACAAVVTFRVAVGATTTPATGHVAGQVTAQVAGQVLRFCRAPRSANEIQESLGLRHRETFQNNYLKPLLERGWLERTIPEKPRSRLQRYRTTTAGLAVLKQSRSE